MDSLEQIERVTVVGLGYVGLPTAHAFASAGFQTRGFDVDSTRVERLKRGENPLPDSELPRLSDFLEDRRLTFTNQPGEAIPQGDAVVVAVPSPITARKEPDLSYLQAAASTVGNHLRRDTLVVFESTVYPGCTEDVLVPIIEEESGLTSAEDFGVAYCPERMNPGDSNHSVGQVVRVLGASDPYWSGVAERLYEQIVPEIHQTRDIKTAEAAKVIENVQRDLNIALVNELSLIFDRIDIDVHDVIDAAATKWNFHRYTPGSGVGGHCLPVDPYYLTWKAREVGHHPEIILAGRRINDAMPRHVVNVTIDVLNTLELPVKGTPITLLGLSYKPNTGDLRNSPGLEIARTLARREADLDVVDPHVEPHLVADEDFTLSGLKEGLEGARAVVASTAHPEFEKLSVADIGGSIEGPACIVDAVALFDSESAKEAKLIYRGIGRS